MPLKSPKRTNQGKIPLVPYQDCPAKTFDSSNGPKIGRSVENHCQIVGEVAKEMIRRLPAEIAQELFPTGAAFMAATHDIGKVSPTFYNKIMRACGREQIPNFSPDLERAWNGHAGVSQVTAKAMGAPEYVPEILGQHHGFSPNVSGLRAKDEKFGSSEWQVEREKLVAALQQSLGENWPEIKSHSQARLLAGLTSVADWIGSGQFFEDPNGPWRDNIRCALDDAGFVPATYKKGLSFDDVFGFPPRAAQRLLIEQASTPGVYVLEAPMGLGKTEAALYAAYQILSTQQATGIYFALPTQLTSNKIFERFSEFLSRVLADDCPHRSLLLHGKAWLQDTEMGEEGSPGGAWFNQAKRGLLAPFAVGTIDQALMAAMNVKHGFVRAFGLAGKIVIMDEVHTYDAYTGSLLDALVKLLRELHCTVIILSATLNHERRKELLDPSVESTAYPLVSALNNKHEIAEISVPHKPGKPFSVKLQQDEEATLEEVLLRAEEGQQVLWIENTVQDAQHRYLDLSARAHELNIATGLLHSRFTINDRQSIEDHWVSLFGKLGRPQRNAQGRILIGTQVLEQSLDIDADFLVTRFAPTDMLLQRIGRLWRHADTPRCPKAKPETWLLVPELEAAIENPNEFGASAYVYSPYVLCRSLGAWQARKSITLPEDIRDLIEATYVSREEQGAMSRWLHELDHGIKRSGQRERKGRIALRQLARVALAEAGVTLPESQAQTRYSEADTLEVLLLKGLNRSEGVTTLTLLNGDRIQLPLQRNALKKSEWRVRTAELMRHIVNVRPQDAPNPLPTKVLKNYGLHHCFYLGNPDFPEDESLLRVALVAETDQLTGVQQAEVHSKHPLEYRNDLGYRVIKNKDAL